MKIAELSQRSGVSVASIKFYSREGLLAPGERIGYNQTLYNDQHLLELRLIRALIDVSGLGLVQVREIVTILDDPALNLSALFDRLRAAAAPDLPPARPEMESLTREFFDDLGWRIGEETEAFRTLSKVIEQFDLIGRMDLMAELKRYAAVSLELASGDLATLGRNMQNHQTIAQTAVVGSILGDSALCALRGAAQDHLAQEIFTEFRRPDSGPGSFGWLAETTDSGESGSETR